MANIKIACIGAMLFFSNYTYTGQNKAIRVETITKADNKKSFSKNEINLSIGDTIEFFNKKTGHNHILYTQKPQKTLRIKKGAKGTKKGERLIVSKDYEKYVGKHFNVKCANHPEMILKVNVQKPKN